MVWGPMIAWYLFLAGASAGAFATSAYIGQKHPTAHRIAFAGRIIAFAALCVGLFMLMLDAEAGLHNPLRFFLLLSNPASVMTIGVYVIIAYMAALVASLVIDLMKRAQPKVLAIVGSVLSLCLAAYTGFLLGAAVPFPLWSNAALPVLFVISGGSAGLAAVLIVGRIVNKAAVADMGELDRMGVVLPIAELFVLFCMLVAVGSTSIEGAATVQSLTTGAYAPAFWIGLVAVGLLMPLGIGAYASKTKSHGAVLGYVANGGVLVGGFLLRYLVIMAAVVTLCV